jgi:hypothetical protein
MRSAGRDHWNQVYETKEPTEVSWYRAHLETSLALIEQAAPARAPAIIDVGGGEATLVDDLLARGYSDLTVLDISAAAFGRDEGPSRVRGRWRALDRWRCRGLEVMRYDAEELHDEFGASFELVRHLEEVHRTPAGRDQQFVWCFCRKMGAHP